MKNVSLRVTVIGLVAALASGPVLAQSGADYGKREFDANCATCHGLSGKGDGPMQAFLTVKPADLTAIAKKNNGVVPVVRLQAVIDGRMELNSHGSRVMPVWGQDYTVKVGTEWPQHMDVPFNPEVFVRSRIMALIDYIARIQQ